MECGAAIFTGREQLSKPNDEGQYSDDVSDMRAQKAVQQTCKILEQECEWCFIDLHKKYCKSRMPFRSQSRKYLITFNDVCYSVVHYLAIPVEEAGVPIDFLVIKSQVF